MALLTSSSYKTSPSVLDNINESNDPNDWSIESLESMEGSLKKLSPNVFSGWQERYFRVADRGTVLVYWKKKPLKGVPEETPSGIINISSVMKIVPRSPLEFSLISTERDWVLMAPTAKEKELWMSVLSTLLSNIRKTKSEEDERNKELFTSILLQKANPGGVFSTANIVENLLNSKKKQHENENDSINKGSVSSNNDKISFLQQKGLYKPIKQSWNTQGEVVEGGGFLDNTLFGSLWCAPHTGGPPLRYYLLIVASTPIVPGKTNTHTPPNFINVNLPNDMKLDTLYLYPYDASNSPPPRLY
eukprot:GHVR01140924.1.p1 GENE.GHVR01140924.1~~GHVR01140924.1.p1  ORF type:complete len:303 (+),score=85.64 GHVR01140924.1:143-1051(+)